MAHINFTSLVSRPAEGFYTSEVGTAQPGPLRTFLPHGYEPNYPYPLLVFLHGHASSDEQILRLAPRLSRRNYICIAPRGPHAAKADKAGRPTFSWGPEDADDPQIEEYIFGCIAQTMRNVHVHTERIYLAGFREGAALAYRLGMMYPEKFAGIVSLNGCMPRLAAPRLRLPEARRLKVFIGHGVANPVVPMSHAKSDSRLFYTAGLNVAFKSYTTTHKIHAEMLKDVDRWVQDHISEDPDPFA